MHTQPVALVTGGSRGIGRGICMALAKTGYAIAVNYHGNEGAARETQRQLPETAESLLCQADVASSDDRRRMMDAVMAKWQRLDVLVNNAGITSVGRFDILQATEESWDLVLGTNLKGPYFLSQLAAREMIRLTENGPPDYRPTIINISSLSAFAVSTNRGDYCISKAAMTMMTQLFASRLADDGIRVFEIRPGVVESDMTAGGREKYTKLIGEGLTPIRRWGTPEDVGRAAVMLASDAMPYSTGDTIHVDGGYHLRQFS